MEAKKKSSKVKIERIKMVKARAAARRIAKSESIEVESFTEKPEPQLRATVADEKSLRALSSLTGYLSVGVVITIFVLVIQLWATLKASFILTAVSFVYIFFSLVSIGALIWCIQLLKQRRMSALWVFIGFIAVNLLYTLAFRWYGGKALTAPSDFIRYIVQAAIIFEIYRLKGKGILN